MSSSIPQPKYHVGQRVVVLPPGDGCSLCTNTLQDAYATGFHNAFEPYWYELQYLAKQGYVFTIDSILRYRPFDGAFRYVVSGIVSDTHITARLVTFRAMEGWLKLADESAAAIADCDVEKLLSVCEGR